ncbi:MAG: hypothetical protein JWO38_2977 [Gemmataceae bacterium]|nr:hypothetical protein [Gemmataceae bacterium]
MELSVLIEPIAGNGFRAWTGEPFPVAAEGATREEALDKLRTALEARTQSVEVVRLRIGHAIPRSPVWPDDKVTHDWLAGIAAARQAADHTPDPWDDPAGAERP